MGAFLVGRPRVPAVLKRSPLGLQFFACAPSHGDSSEPESVEHQMAKIALVKGLRAAGVPAFVERPGCSLFGEEWVADVFAQTSSGSVVFEVQLSQQHWTTTGYVRIDTRPRAHGACGLSGKFTSTRSPKLASGI